MNLINRNLGTYNPEVNNLIYNSNTRQINKIKYELNRTDSNNDFNIYKSKNNNNYSPYYTNFDITEKNSLTQTNKNKSSIKLKKPIRVLNTVQKLISNKINRIMPNTNSIFHLSKNDSINSFKTQNNRYGIDLLNNLIQSNKPKKINSKSNNNSLNKKSDYITPLKKKFLYYYH